MPLTWLNDKWEMVKYFWRFKLLTNYRLTKIRIVLKNLGRSQKIT